MFVALLPPPIPDQYANFVTVPILSSFLQHATPFPVLTYGQARDRQTTVINALCPTVRVHNNSQSLQQ